MTLFTKVEDAQAVILDGTVERQVDVYERNGRLYVEVGKNRFLRLYADGRTLNPKVKIDELHCDEQLYKDPLGRLGFSSVKGAVKLGKPATDKLMALEDKSDG